MAVLSKGTTYANGDQVTSVNLNAHVDNATFASGAVDNISTQLSGGAIIVKDGGVNTAKLADNAVTTAKITNSNVTTAKIADANVTTAKIADSNVTKAKIENVADMKVLGNTSGSATAPQEVSVLDEDDMVSDSATSLATQQSIKAYVDTNVNDHAICSVADGNQGPTGSDFNLTFSITNQSGSIATINAGDIDLVAGVYMVFLQGEFRESDANEGDYYDVLLQKDGVTVYSQKISETGGLYDYVIASSVDVTGSSTWSVRIDFSDTTIAIWQNVKLSFLKVG
jgi:hypothetical protein